MMFVEQKKPSWWTLFFACAYLISGVGVFVLGLLAKDVWQILSGLFLFSLGQQIAASYAGRFGDVHVMRTQSTCPSTGYRHVTRSSGRCVHSFLRICHMSKANVGTARTLTSVWSASPICSSFLRRVGRFVYLLSASLRRRGKDPKRSTFEDGA